MRLRRVDLVAYGRCNSVGIDIGENLTLVVGTNEAGKSTALDALTDLLWGIPPRSTRASDVVRSQLRVDAVVDVDGETHRRVRKSTGLFADDLLTAIPAPWDPSNTLNRNWWRTRLGINHTDLQDAGKATFGGTGDIADIIFAAREGRSAREILNSITERAEGLFKPNRGNRSVLLRVAEKGYEGALADRSERLTFAADVIDQRETCSSLSRRLDEARENVAAASRNLRRAEESKRVIAGVLELRLARRDIELLDAEGDRLSPAELAEYLEQVSALEECDTAIARLDAEIQRKTADISELSVADRLLDDKATIDRLQPDVKARIEDLSRADQEFGPAVSADTDKLRRLLHSIGIETVDDVDAALGGVGVRSDHAATLDDLADRIEHLGRTRARAIEDRDKALGDLVAKGIAVDLAAATAPREECIAALRDALTTARDRESSATAVLAKARETTNALRGTAPTPVRAPEITHAAVIEARKTRDSQWGVIRQSWLSDDRADPQNRIGLAGELDRTTKAADQTSDQEATERARVAADDSRIEAHVKGFDSARKGEEAAHTALVDAQRERERAESAWNAAWIDVGVAPAPDVDASSAITALLVTAHTAECEILSAAQQRAELSEAWGAATAAVGLTAADTTAAWRKQSEVLDQIIATRDSRSESQARESKARRAWDSFAAEALEILLRHRAAEPGQSLTPTAIEQGLTKLVRELNEATKAATKRSTYRDQIADLSDHRDTAGQKRGESTECLDQLAQSHHVDPGEDLDVLADRAQRATDPLARESDARRMIENGLDPGNDPAAVIDRLSSYDQDSVEQDLEKACNDVEEAQSDADRCLADHTSARYRLTELEKSPSAADAEAEVAARQAEVARLTEEWAVLALQRKLLNNVLDGLASADSRPLLDHAGRMLEKLTGGRWAALRADDTGGPRTLSVIRGDGERFGTSGLSEGTVDQVFLALRLAAVAELHSERVAAGEQALPLVLDDVLMTFDEGRTTSALEVLADLAPGLQVIVFTHHGFVADAAAELDRITVSRLPAPAVITDPLDSELLRVQAQRGSEPSTPDSAGPAAPRKVGKQAVRQWLRDQGIEVGEKGRVPKQYNDMYRAAHPEADL
jgi:uncharacterized protein YhaN